LLAYMMKGIEDAHHGFPAVLATAIATPLAVFAIWLFLERVKKRLLH